MPDLYIDELQEMLAATCRANVSRSTVWRALSRGGFTLKKVSIIVLMCNIQLAYFCRSHVLQQNVLLKNDSIILTGSVHTTHPSWFSSMKAWSTVEQHIVGEHIPFAEVRHSRRLSLYVGGGVLFPLCCMYTLIANC
jgi:hypothetical protein